MTTVISKHFPAPCTYLSPWLGVAAAAVVVRPCRPPPPPLRGPRFGCSCAFVLVSPPSWTYLQIGGPQINVSTLLSAGRIRHTYHVGSSLACCRHCSGDYVCCSSSSSFASIGWWCWSCRHCRDVCLDDDGVGGHVCSPRGVSPPPRHYYFARRGHLSWSHHHHHQQCSWSSSSPRLLVKSYTKEIKTLAQCDKWKGRRECINK